MPTAAIISNWLNGWIEGPPPPTHIGRGDLVLSGAHGLRVGGPHALSVGMTSELAMSGGGRLRVGSQDDLVVDE